MKTLFVKELEKLIGSKIQDTFVVISKLNRTTRKGKPYWQLVLADSSGQVGGRIWNNSDLSGTAFESGHVLEIVANVETYGGALQLNIEKLRRLSLSEVELANFPMGTTGNPDDLASLVEFGVDAGNWVMTDVSSEIALQTQRKMEAIKEKYLGPSEGQPNPQEKRPMIRPPSRVNVDTDENRRKTEELKRRYLSRVPEDREV